MVPLFRPIIYNRRMKTPMLLYLKGLLAPLCFCSKRYQIPFCSMLPPAKSKKSAKIKVYCMRRSTTLLQFAERVQSTFRAVTIWITLYAESMNCMQPRSCFAIPLREHKLEYKNGGEIKIFFFNYLGFFYSTRPIQPDHFKADQIWCDGTFKGTVS
jgi:hypothetical protein